MNQEKTEVSENEQLSRDTVNHNEERIINIPLSQIKEFQNHPFKIRDDDEMRKLITSIHDFGVLTPVIVRPIGFEAYELISGHRRKRASELAGLATLPCIVRDLSDDEATILMVDTNMQRETVLPSERAFSYKMKLEALKRQGARTDLTFDPSEQKSKVDSSREMVATEFGESPSQIQRYIRLTELISPLLQMVDDGTLFFRAAVELSYLTQQEQEDLKSVIDELDCNPTLEQSLKFKKLSKANELTREAMFTILEAEDGRKQNWVKVPAGVLERFFEEGTPTKEIVKEIVNAMEFYKANA